MKTAHTPGPWRVKFTDGFAPAHVIGQDYRPICSFLASVKRNCGEGEITANARLITASPRMSDTLKRAAHLLAELPDQSPQLLALRAEIVECIKQATPEYYATGEES